MKAKLIKILLDHDVTFRKVDENHPNTKGFCLEGFSVMSQHVLGNSKEEILQKMYDIDKKQQKEFKRYNSLMSTEEFMDSILTNDKFHLKKKYKLRNGDKTNRYPTYTNEAIGVEWLRKKWIKEYTSIIPETFTLKGFCFTWDVKRNDKPIGWTLWEKYRNLVEKWEAELKNK